MSDKALDSWQLAFRRQLILPEQKEVFDYWHTCRGRRAMPSRADINPARLKKHLPTVSLLNVVDENTFSVRLAGTGIREILDEEITGRYLSDIDFKEHQAYWQAAHHRVATEKRPAQGVAPVTWRDKGNLFVFWLRLPLSSDGQKVEMILGYDLYLAAAKADALSRQKQLVASGG